MTLFEPGQMRVRSNRKMVRVLACVLYTSILIPLIIPVTVAMCIVRISMAAVSALSYCILACVYSLVAVWDDNWRN